MYFFSLLLRPICFLPNVTSQLKILHGNAQGKYCQYSSQRTLCYEAKKQVFNESLVVMLFEFNISSRSSMEDTRIKETIKQDKMS